MEAGGGGAGGREAGCREAPGYRPLQSLVSYKVKWGASLVSIQTRLGMARLGQKNGLSRVFGVDLSRGVDFIPPGI